MASVDLMLILFYVPAQRSGAETQTKTIILYSLYFVDHASHYKFLLIINLMHFFMYLFISYFCMFRASQRSPSGD